MSLTRSVLLLSLLALSWVSSAAPVSLEGCEAGGKMVQSFALMRDQGKPIQDVYAFIEKLPDADAQQTAFYKKLADTTYAQKGMAPDAARESFVAFCTRKGS